MFYVAHKLRGEATARGYVSSILQACRVCTCDHKLLLAALASPIRDYEDATQVTAAEFYDLDAVVTRNLPPEVHHKLKLLAQRNRRSLSEEASSLLEQALATQAYDTRELPVPVVGTFPLTDEWLASAKSEGRA